jgi:hypothetical protein
MTFIEEKPAAALHVPFYEDADAKAAPGYSTSKNPEALQAEIIMLIDKMGGSQPMFRAGMFEMDGRERYGYVLDFRFVGMPAALKVAGLPMRSETPTKKRQVQAHALYVIREWLISQKTARLFSPGSEPLAQYIFTSSADGITFGEFVVSGQLASLLLNAPGAQTP